VYSGLDFLAYSVTLQQLENENEELTKENEDMKKKLASVVEKDFVAKSKRSPVKKRQSLKTKNMFSAECVATSTSVKGIFEYYTGLTYARFLMLTNFLFPTTEINPVKYEKKRKEVQNMDLSDQLFLVLCRLRNGLHVKDLAYRFNIKQQSVSLIFKSMVHYMHLKLSYLSYWPKRDVMIKNMPLK
jgi:hypothetical protein